MAIAKICGVTSPEGLAAALDGGAAFIGFNFFAASPRYIEIDAARDLAAEARGRARIVAVTVDPDDDLLVRLKTVLRPDFIQLHGQESPDRAAEAKRLAGAGVIKAIPIRAASDVKQADAYDLLVDHLMFDAKAPKGADRPGGHGAAYDWSVLSGRRFARPWFLAGGLNPDNVAAAIVASGAPMVDVSSGVEDAGGLKEPALIGRFLAAAQATSRA